MILNVYFINNIDFEKKMYYSRKNSDNFAYFARKLNVFAL